MTEINSNIEYDQKVKQISLVDLIPNEFNPRARFNEEEEEELIDSILSKGILNPIIVYFDSKKSKYVILDGERRFRACKKINIKTIPARILLKEPDLLESLSLMFHIHNVREDWTEFAISMTIRRIVDEMGKVFTKKTDDIMKFHIEGKACISNSTENGHFCPTSCAAYINTVDDNKAKLGLKNYIDKQLEIAKDTNVSAMTTEQLTRRFDLTEKARYFYTNNKDEPNVFTFKIETVGVIPSLIIFHRSIDILKDKINNFVSNLINNNEDIITINPSSQLNGGYDIIIKDEDDTLGNILQTHLCLLYADYTIPKEQRKLQFIGYKRPHPLENHIILALHGSSNEKMPTLITDIIKPGCQQIIKVFNKIQSELESNTHFVSELKRIN